MANSLVITAPGNLSAPLTTTPRRLYTFPTVTPTRRWVASQLALAIGANVPTWNALDGSFAFAQGTAGLQPTLERVNNVYGVKFDASDDIMGAGNGSAPDTAYTVISVLRAPVVTNSKAMLNFRGNFFGVNGSGVLRLRGNTTDIIPTGSPAMDTGLHFVAAIINGASSICRYDGYVATGDPGVFTSSTQLATATGPSVSFAEIAYFNSALTDSQLQSIRTGLKTIYPTLP